METRIFVEGKFIDIEYKLADDCVFSVSIDVDNAADMIRKLEQAVKCARNGTIHWRDEVG